VDKIDTSELKETLSRLEDLCEELWGKDWKREEESEDLK